MNKRGFITAVIILIIAGALVFSAVYLSLKRTEKAQEIADSKNTANITASIPDSAGESTCVSNSDCLPTSCCHPSKCTSADKAPNCKGTFCTMECSPNSLDCGQGSCACVNNKCAAVFK